MPLPILPPLDPQLAKAGKGELPVGPGWLYEPKWDGFRAIVFVDGQDVVIQSRGGKTLGRYFPELAFPPGRYVVDGEIVIDGEQEGSTEFALLQARIHPAESRIARLSVETPARFVAFDLLARDDESLLDQPFVQRRLALHEIDGLELTPATTDPDVARGWLGTLEGVIAKEIDAPYRPGKRTGMVKVRQVRTVDLVVMGYRDGTPAGTVGSLILGAYDENGRLVQVGHSSGFTAARKRELATIVGPLATGLTSAPEPNRWTGEKETSWHAVRPELVVEVTFDHSSEGKIRHGSRLVRFRTDREPTSCLLRDVGLSG